MKCPYYLGKQKCRVYDLEQAGKTCDGELTYYRFQHAWGCPYVGLIGDTESVLTMLIENDVYKKIGGDKGGLAERIRDFFRHYS